MSRSTIGYNKRKSQRTAKYTHDYRGPPVRTKQEILDTISKPELYDLAHTTHTYSALLKMVVHKESHVLLEDIILPDGTELEHAWVNIPKSDIPVHNKLMRKRIRFTATVSKYLSPTYQTKMGFTNLQIIKD